MNINNIDKVFNHYKQLLADKHNAIGNKLNKVVMIALLKDKRTRLNTAVKDYFVFYDSKEYLKRFYLKKESKVRIPKFAMYYKDYLKYFCKAMIKDLSVNKVLMRNMEKVAQDFYYNNYQKGNNGCNGDKKEVKRNSPRCYGGCGSKSSNKFFDKRVVNEIEKGKYSGDNGDGKNKNKNNLLKKSISNQNISAISRILPITDKHSSSNNNNNNNVDNQSNDSLMESILLSLETKKQKDIPPKTKITNNNNKPTYNVNDNNIKHHKTPFPSSSLVKTKSSLKISNNITSIHLSKDTPPTNLYHSTQFKHPSNLSSKLKLHPHSNNNNNTTTTSNTKSFNNQQLHHHPSTQVVYQYQKYRFNSSDKTPIPPNIIPSPNTMTISSPKHSIHLLSVSPSNSHQKIWSPPHSNNANKTSYQRFMLQNKSGQLNRMVTSSTITNTLMHGSPTGIKIKSKTKMSFNNNSKQTFTRMKSFSLRNSIGIEDNLNGGSSGVVLPNNYRKGNKGGYLYGSVTSLYKRDFKTMVKGENVKTNRHDASKTYNNTLRMNYNRGGKYSN